MKKLFKKIKKNGRDILELDCRIEDIKTMPYYKIFGSEPERERDLKDCYKHKKTLLDARQAMLERLKIEIELELAQISNQQRDNKICILNLENPLVRN